MLEDIAINYLSQSESNMKTINYGFIAIGALIAGVTNRSDTELARAPYFACSALIIFAASAAQVVWLPSLNAMKGGYLWLLMAISLASVLALGFFMSKIAIARSRDAYGHGRMAILAFIPFANFWLLLKSSKSTLSANRTLTTPLLTGGLGVVFGFVMLTAAGLVTIFIEREGNRLIQQAQREPALQQAGIEFLIRSKGLEETLRLITAETRTPITIDNLTILARIEAVGAQLRRTYIVDLKDAAMSDDFRKVVTDRICAHALLLTLLRAGATIREVYLQRDRQEIGAVMVTRAECGV